MTVETDGWFIRLSLSVGILVSVLGCITSILAAIWSLWEIPTEWASSRSLYLLGSVVGFFYSAGMGIVFARAMR
jgi:hypothetical protein